MDLITFAFTQSHAYGSAFSDFLELRKRFFVDTLGWDIPHDDRFEMDQYDNPTAHYSIVLRDGVVIGGARAQPTTARWGDHSYMLRDAQLGKLGKIPSGLLKDQIVDEMVWECTRFVIDESVETVTDRQTCLRLLAQGLIDITARHGADQVISISPVTMMRALRQLGFQVHRLGDPYMAEEDGRRYAVLNMRAANGAGVTPAATHRMQNQAVLHAPSR